MHALVITGTTGSGKTTLAYHLAQDGLRFSFVRAVTTRPPRPDDDSRTYEYVPTADYSEARQTDVFFLEATYRGFEYGIPRAAVNEILLAKKIPIVITSPLTVSRNIRAHDGSRRLLAVFLDAPDSVLDHRLRTRGQTGSWTQVQHVRTEDRHHASFCDLSITNLDITATTQQVLDLIQNMWMPSNISVDL